MSETLAALRRLRIEKFSTGSRDMEGPNSKAALLNKIKAMEDRIVEMERELRDSGEPQSSGIVEAIDSLPRIVPSPS